VPERSGVGVPASSTSRADRDAARQQRAEAMARGEGPSSRRRSRPGKTSFEDRPPAPWGKFPLVELCVLLALVLGVLGFVQGGRRGFVLLGCAMALGSLAGLELSIREHFAGYRSHTTVLAGALAVAAGAGLWFAHLPQVAILPVAVAVFAAAFFALREVFRRRSGGYGFR
jgi:hypothetical protein